MSTIALTDGITTHSHKQEASNAMDVSMRIMIIEDYEPLARVAIMNLEILEPEIIIDVVDNVEDAVGHLRANEYHAILLDCNLVDVKGSVAIKRIKPHIDYCPIIIQTAIKDAAIIENIKKEMRPQDRLYIKEANTLEVSDALRAGAKNYIKQWVNHEHKRD